MAWRSMQACELPGSFTTTLFLINSHLMSSVLINVKKHTRSLLDQAHSTATLPAWHVRLVQAQQAGQPQLSTVSG